MKYLDDNPKTIYGVAKPGLTHVPPAALFMVGQVMACGAEKYGPMNWRDAKVTRSTYINAALRHIFQDWDGQDRDMETLLPNLAHAAACLLIVLDAAQQGMLNDDRPTPGMTSHFLKANTKGITDSV